MFWWDHTSHTEQPGLVSPSPSLPPLVTGHRSGPSWCRGHCCCGAALWPVWWQHPGHCVERGTLSSPSRPLRCCPLPCPASTIQPQLRSRTHPHPHPDNIPALRHTTYSHPATTQPSSNWNCRYQDGGLEVTWRTVNLTNLDKFWVQQFL